MFWLNVPETFVALFDDSSKSFEEFCFVLLSWINYTLMFHFSICIICDLVFLI